MNWPALHQRSSEVLADVLRNSVHTKPKDLFEFVAQALQEQSGLDPEEFEQFFEECKRKPRTYVLEDRCPLGQEPLSWVPMRFDDDTILRTLGTRLHEVTSEILAALPIEDTKGYLDRLCIAMPELMYLREKPSEPVATQRSFAGAELAGFQALRAAYLCFTGSEPPAMDDESVEFSFLCEALITDTRTQLKSWSTDISGLETLIVLLMLRAVGSHLAFQKRYGGGHQVPEQAALHAIAYEARALPSFHRLAESQQALIKACLEVWLPLEMVCSMEACPGHFMSLKDKLVPIEGGLIFFVTAITVDYAVSMRNTIMMDEAVDLVRLSANGLLGVEKYSSHRAYEMLLKKRAERHSWRIVRDDLFLKAIVRLCCFSAQEDTDYWNQLQNICDELPQPTKEVLKRELALKDGVSDTPAYFLVRGSRFVEAACTNPALGPAPAVAFIAQVLEEAAKAFDKRSSLNRRMVPIDLGGVARYARDFTGGTKLEDTPFELVETVASPLVVVQLAGA